MDIFQNIVLGFQMIVWGFQIIDLVFQIIVLVFQIIVLVFQIIDLDFQIIVLGFQIIVLGFYYFIYYFFIKILIRFRPRLEFIFAVPLIFKKTENLIIFKNGRFFEILAFVENPRLFQKSSLISKIRKTPCKNFFFVFWVLQALMNNLLQQAKF
jgi:hypothetical protein